MKQKAVLAVTVAVILILLFSAIATIDLLSKPLITSLGSDAYVGVDVGFGDENDLYRVADAVMGRANLLIIGSLQVTTNTSKLINACNYLYERGFSFIIYVGFAKNGYYPPQGPDKDFFNTTARQWGDKFLGAYIFDEPGGKQLDYPLSNFDKPVKEAANYSDAAQQYIHIVNGALANYTGPNYYDAPNLQVFTSDYALYWFDYAFGGYNAVFGEFVGNQSRQIAVALCRGAATAQNKDWGIIITFSTCTPQGCLENGTELYKDMTLAWDSGAKYVLVFDSPGPNGTVTSPLGILEKEHLDAMKSFWSYAQSHPKTQKRIAETAYVLPRDYGFGFRAPNDNIWGIWPADSLAPQVWDQTNALIGTYGSKFDIVYETLSDSYSIRLMYNRLIFWNGTTIGEP